MLMCMNTDIPEPRQGGDEKDPFEAMPPAVLRRVARLIQADPFWEGSYGFAEVLAEVVLRALLESSGTSGWTLRNLEED